LELLHIAFSFLCGRVNGPAVGVASMKLGVHRFVFSQVALMDGVASLGCFGATEEGLHSVFLNFLFMLLMVAGLWGELVY